MEFREEDILHNMQIKSYKKYSIGVQLNCTPILQIRIEAVQNLKGPYSHPINQPPYTGDKQRNSQNYLETSSIWPLCMSLPSNQDVICFCEYRDYLFWTCISDSDLAIDAGSSIYDSGLHTCHYLPISDPEKGIPDNPMFRLAVI